MSIRRNVVWIIVFVAMLAVPGVTLRSGVAQKAAAPKPQDELARRGRGQAVAAPYGYRQERQDIQARVDEV